MTTYYVRTDGNNGNNGLTNSSGGAWATITYAESAISRGDIVRVQSGTYDEAVTIDIATSGSTYVTFIGEGETRPVLRRFTISGVSYVRIINFEITHNDNDYNGAIVGAGTTSYVQILDNYIHNVRGASSGEGAAIYGAGTPTYWTLRGNTLYYMGYIAGVYTSGNTWAIGTLAPNAAYWLVEYNTIQRSLDYTTIYGQNHIIRNNYMYDADGAYWSVDDGESGFHLDFFQPGSDGQQSNTRYQVIEANFMSDSDFYHSHGMLLQDNGGYGDTDIILRGNIHARIGGVGGFATDNVIMYNNTLYQCNPKFTGAATIIMYNRGGDQALGLVCINNLLSEDNATDPMQLNDYPQTGMISEYNMGYDSGTDSSYVSTGDPLFTSPTSPTYNFHLSSVSSPAYQAGRAITTIATAANPTGTTQFAVATGTGRRFTDGKGIAGEGDTITVNGTTVRITNISTDTITVSANVTWDTNEPVYWGSSSTPDIGALPYGSVELSAATISNVGTTYTVTTTGDARGVWFYQDGVPNTWTSASPYQATIASGTITAKAYSLYASKTPTVEATASESPPRTLFRP